MKNIRSITYGAVIAAIYVVLTVVLGDFARGAVQVRISEALCILAAFTFPAVPGLFVGCLLSNLILGCALPDIIFGSLATLIGAYGAYLLRDKNRFLIPLPTVLANTLIVPFVLRFAYGSDEAMLYMFITIFIGEFISAEILGACLYSALKNRSSVIFKTNK